MNRFLGALQFLTIVPVRRQTGASANSPIFFPLVGALLGLSCAGILFVFRPPLEHSLAALLAIGWLIMITGCLHEDGLADVADAFRVGRSREKIMSILKDSRIGTYGGVVLVMSTLLRWQALAQCVVPAVRTLPAVLALSRASLVVMAHIAPPAGEGLGREFASGCTRAVTIAVVAQALGLSFLAGWRLALAMILASTVTILLARIYFLKTARRCQWRLPRRDVSHG